MHRFSRKQHARVRYSGFAVVAVVVVAALCILSGSCFFDAETQVCEVSGLRCPLGWSCSADQKSCIQGGCGDNIVSGDEVCDDGNVEGGDGCSADCMSNETCGNGITDPNESCDDGRNDDGDGCSAACEVEACGNGLVDVNEQCDPGMPLSGMPLQDTAACDIDCTFIMCGDGHINEAAGEKCDTGDPMNPDPLNTPNKADCNGPLCTLPVCGDSFFNPMADEECDTGGDSQACNGGDAKNGMSDSFCKIPKCGDYYKNNKFKPPATGLVEECDEGGVDTMKCDFDCTNPACGDNHQNIMAGEECDDGNLANNDSCVSVGGVCKTARCGDGYTRTEGANPEVCDDGNDSTEDGCPSGPNGNCQVATCGDGYINKAGGAEICDPGNTSMPEVGCTKPATCVSTGPDKCKKCI